MNETILTKGKLKKITSGKEVEIVLTLNSTVSLDDLQDLKEREESIYIALGTSQMEVRDYLEPRRGYQAVVDGTGFVQSISKPADEEGEQVDIEDVIVEEAEAGEGDTANEDEVAEELHETENHEEVTEEGREHAENNLPFTPDTDEEEDQDAPLTFLDEE
ncbi:hypothetical protein [Bacillus sp. 3255]|uniref:hypothetical protein n=1 Tax=Bacillus sp. 3255 TaxID=2817904 RepID=UPI0028563C0E|nr:hypothetical protein [Bacillus sp. 3255]MDR6884892.1 hypothetical protein [Bacillus sp. 3255]